MHHRFIVVMLLVACRTSSEPSPAAKGSAPVPASTPAPEPTCAPGAFKNSGTDHPSFCLTLPSGFALSSSGVDHSKPDLWHYIFFAEGEKRATLQVLVQHAPKPGIASLLTKYGPNGTHGPQSMVKTLEVNVPNGKRIVARDENYERDSATEDEFVALSKGHAVGVDAEWVVFCHSSSAKQAPAGDRLPCLTIQML